MFAVLFYRTSPQTYAHATLSHTTIRWLTPLQLMLGTVPPRYGWDGVRLDSTPTSPWLEEMPLYPLWKWSNGFIPTSKWWLCFKCSVDSNFSGIVSYILNYCYCVEPAISLPLNWDLIWSSLMLLTRQLMNTRRQRRYVSVVIFLVHFFYQFILSYIQ